MGLFDIFKKKNTPEPVSEETAQSPVCESENQPQPKAQLPQEEKKSGFVGFALLSDATWDKERFKRDLANCWEISPNENDEADEQTLIYSVGDMRVIAGIIDAPIPNGEAEINAANNYLWPEAENTIKSHKAHIVVSVSGESADPVERGKLFVKLLHCCCLQPDILGIYFCKTVFEPQFYIEAAEIMKSGALPLLNWIWFGLYKRDDKVCCYTYGMKNFGKNDMEILDADALPSDVRDFMLDMVSYVLENSITLADGETIGLSAEDKHTITVSEGVSLPETTVKISY